MLDNKTSQTWDQVWSSQAPKCFFITLPKHTSKASTQIPSKQVKTPYNWWKPFKRKTSGLATTLWKNKEMKTTKTKQRLPKDKQTKLKNKKV